MDVTEFCLFCPTEFPAGAGSPEHIFLSSIGGRVATRHAICAQCNNAFSNIETNEADQALRGMLLHACNALNIVSGRGDAPPIIERAYEESPGVFYDLAPGLVPVPRRAVIPRTEDLRGKSEHGFVASDRADARRVLEILRLRKDELRSLGVEVTIGAPTVVSRHLPGFNVPLKFNVQAAARCVAKTAAVAANVLHGNAVARNHVDADLRIAARNANSDMQPFVAFGFEKPWVRLENVRPHPQTPQAISSGFEHSVSLVDVRARWVAFVEFFGAYRFTVDMGAQSGLPSCALIVNPRAATRSLLQADVVAPEVYAHPAESLMDQGATFTPNLKSATQRALEDCYATGRAAHAAGLGDELHDMLDAAGDDLAARNIAVKRWSKKLATLESGAEWSELIDLFLD